MSGLAQTMLEVVIKYQNDRKGFPYNKERIDFDIFTEEDKGEVLAGYLTEILKADANECLEDIDPRDFAALMNPGGSIDFEAIGRRVFEAMINHCHEGIQTLVDKAVE